jgi:hypothetical protein
MSDLITTKKAETKKQLELQDVISQFEDSSLSLMRSLAAYTHLADAFRSLSATAMPGERRKGPPIFKFSATANGRQAIEVAIDTGRLSPEDVAIILPILLKVPGQDMVDALQDVDCCVQDLKAMLTEPEEAT